MTPDQARGYAKFCGWLRWHKPKFPESKEALKPKMILQCGQTLAVQTAKKTKARHPSRPDNADGMARKVSQVNDLGLPLPNTVPGANPGQGTA